MIPADGGLLLSALLAGLLGSGHCVGMCGGISAALSFALPAQHRQGWRFWALQLGYNGGRLLSYSLLGLLLGLLAQQLPASWLHSPGPRLLAALMMVLLGLYLAGLSLLLQKLEGLGARLWRWLQPLRKKVLPVDTQAKALVAGMLWGLLPCGLVYSALSLALLRADATASALTMLAFGVGTLPALLLAGSLAGQLRQWLQNRHVRRGAGLVVVGFGLWTAWAALAHGMHHPAPLPSASPAPASTPPHTHQHSH